MTSKASLRVGAAPLAEAGNVHSHDNGTALANYSDTSSCTLAPPVIGRLGNWGGARNRADRVSVCLTEKQIAALMESAAYAFATGRIFQRHWTVHYGLAGIKPEDGARFVGKLLDLVRKQARRMGGEMAAIWVRECASDKGEHVHILLFLPAGMSLRNRTRRWIEAAGGACHKGVSKVTIIGGRLTKVEGDNEAVVRENAANVLRYLLKASTVEVGMRLGLSRIGKNGRIVGKRCGRTQNIGRGARGSDCA